MKDIKQQYEISKSDEDSLLKLMSECDFASSNAEKFIEKLQTELLQLDTVSLFYDILSFYFFQQKTTTISKHYCCF